MIEKLKLTARQSFIYSIANIAGKLSGFVLLPLYSIYITIDEYGLMALFDIIFEILLAISGWGMSVALPRWYYIKESRGKEKSLFFTTFIFLFFVTLVFCALAFYITFEFDKIIFSTEISRRMLFIFIMSAVSRILLQTPLLLMRIKQEASKQTSFQLINLLLLVGLTALFLVVFKMKLEGIFLAQLISSVFTFLFVIPYIKINSRLKFEFGLLKEMFHFATPVLVSNLISLTLILSDRYILAYFGSLADTGEFQLAYRISNIVKLILVQSFMSAFTNIYYKDMEQKETGRFFAKSMTYFVYVGVLLSLGLSLFSREFLTILSLNNPDYINSYSIIPFLIFGVVFAGMRQFIALPLFKHKKTKFTAIVSIGSAFINLILNILLIPFWGVYAAAGTTTFSQFLVIVVYYFALRKIEAVNLEVKKIALLFSLAVVFYLSSFLFFDFSIYMRLILKTILFILFPILLYPLNFYEKIELDKIKQLFLSIKNRIKK